LDPASLFLSIDLKYTRKEGLRLKVVYKSKDEIIETEHALSQRQVEMVLAGSLINLVCHLGK
jgi:aconitate hydratase